ncbi:MAG: hypothetical protein ACI8WT_003884 [Clostridium sp.]|jgi:hypothetical protein
MIKVIIADDSAIKSRYCEPVYTTKQEVKELMPCYP